MVTFEKVEGLRYHVRYFKDQMAITNDWEIWCDEDGKFWNREIPFTVLEEREYQPEEKMLLISEKQKK